MDRSSSPLPSTSRTMDRSSSPFPSTSKTMDRSSSPLPSTSRTLDRSSSPLPSTSRTLDRSSSPLPSTSRTLDRSPNPPPSSTSRALCRHYRRGLLRRARQVMTAIVMTDYDGKLFKSNLYEIIIMFHFGSANYYYNYFCFSLSQIMISKTSYLHLPFKQ